MDIYTLTSKAKARLRDGRGDRETQETFLYRVMDKDLKGGPATFDQIVETCERRGYESLITSEQVLQFVHP